MQPPAALGQSKAFTRHKVAYYRMQIVGDILLRRVALVTGARRRQQDRFPLCLEGEENLRGRSNRPDVIS